MRARAYLERIKVKLASSALIKDVTIVQEYALADRGYLRARLILVNDDFLEVSEYFVVIRGRPKVVEYRHQWMDPTRQVLRKRWDNASHHAGLPNQPHHIHLAEDANVKPGRSLSILDVVDVIAVEVSAVP